MSQGRSFKMRSQIGPKTEQDSLSIAAKSLFRRGILKKRNIFISLGPPGEKSGFAPHPAAQP